jgi:hypothetical protein
VTTPVDHDLLADYLGGALDGTPEHEQVSALISTSPGWRQAAQDLTLALASVSEDLHLLSGYPEKMPVDLADRFDVLLASPEMSPQPAKNPRDPLAERTVQRTAPAKRQRWRKWTVPVAVAVAMGSFFVLRNTPMVGSTFGGTTQQPVTAERMPQDSALTPESASSVPTTASGREHSRTSLRQFSSLPSESTFSQTPDYASPLSGGPGIAQQSELDRLRDPLALQKCLTFVRVALPGAITLVDYSSFEGSPALVISITSQGKGWTFVAGPSCGIDDADEIFRAPLQ